MILGSKTEDSEKGSKRKKKEREKEREHKQMESAMIDL